jgi:hypothetical protein
MDDSSRFEVNVFADNITTCNDSADDGKFQLVRMKNITSGMCTYTSDSGNVLVAKDAYSNALMTGCK